MQPLLELLSEEAKSAVAAIAAEDCDVVLFNAGINRGTQECLLKAIRPPGSRGKRVMLVLLSEGGDPHAAYKIARLLQLRYERVVCFVPDYTKSAATIVVIGAHDLVIGDNGELGPVDVQLSKTDTLGQYESGLTVLTALNTLHEKAYSAWEHFFLEMERKSEGSITLKTAAHVSAELTAGLFSPVFGQINPLQLGEAARAMLIGSEYGRRLNDVTKNVRPGALDSLVTKYPDHAFVIDRREAERLFWRVREATKIEQELSDALGSLADVEIGRRQSLIGYLNEAMAPSAAAPAQHGEENATIANGGAGAADGVGAALKASRAALPADGQPLPR